MDASDIDLLDRDEFAKDIPHEWFTWLRANAPVYRHPEPGGPGFWVVTKHADVITCNRAWEKLSSAGERGGVVAVEDRLTAEMGDAPSMAGNLMLQMDPPRHTRYRKLVNRGFTPRMIQRLEPHIRELTVHILDEAWRKDAVRLRRRHRRRAAPRSHRRAHRGAPRRAAQDLRVVEQDDRLRGPGVHGRRVRGDERPGRDVHVRAAARREAPRAARGDDIITALLSADVDGESLSDMDFNLFFLLLSVAGNETTRNAISHGMNAFLENPDQYDELVADPAGRIAGARPRRSCGGRRRSSTSGATPRPTSSCAASRSRRATRSPSGTSRPTATRTSSTTRSRFDIDREPNDHIAFGGGGPHFCLGAQLARMEIHVLFEELARRVPRVEALGAPDRLRSNFIGGIKHLPVRLPPALTSAHVR